MTVSTLQRVYSGSRTLTAQLRHGEESAARSGVMPEGACLVECALRHSTGASRGDHDLALATVQEVNSDAWRPLAYWRKAFHWLEVHYPFASSGAKLRKNAMTPGITTHFTRFWASVITRVIAGCTDECRRLAW
jgi:hypothetical protein